MAYARFMTSAPSSDSFGNMVVEPPLPESTKVRVRVRVRVRVS